jgi:hypothetical protein
LGIQSEEKKKYKKGELHKKIHSFANQTQSTERNRERVAKRSIKKAEEKGDKRQGCLWMTCDWKRAMGIKWWRVKGGGTCCWE